MESMSWRRKAQRVAEAARNIRAEDVVILVLPEPTSIADAFVIASGRSDRQVRAIADGVVQAMRELNEPSCAVEGYREGRWISLDLADVIVHIFQTEARKDYDLERLWSDAERIAIATAPSDAPSARLAP